VIADDQTPTRDGLRQLLSAENDIAVTGEAADGHDLLAVASRHRPAVVLTDIRMPKMDGLRAIQRLNALDSGPAVIAMTTFDTDEYLYGALRAGAVGFLLKDSDPDLLIDAVRAAARGQGLIDPQVTRRLVHRFAAISPEPPSPELATLTTRETEILRLVTDGLSNADIAEKLTIAYGTVKIHVAHILTKLGVETRVQAVIYAHRHGL
jgi:DNA-binding NarL/FixJ family response regulator